MSIESSRMGVRVQRLMLWVAAVPLAGCAAVPDPTVTDVHLTEAPDPSQVTLSEPARLRLGRYELTVPAGAWRHLGSIPAGDVYKPVDSVLIVGGSDSYEAYLVVSEGAAVGIYMPFENSFVVARDPVPLQMEVA